MSSESDYEAGTAAESALVGCAVAFSTELEVRRCVFETDPEDFSDTELGELFAYVRERLEAGREFDPVILQEERPALAELALDVSSSVVTSASVADYARQVRVSACRRLARVRTEQAWKALADPLKDPIKVLATLHDQAAQLATRAASVGDRPASMADLVRASLDPDRALPEAVIPTGLSELDEVLDGGYEPGHMIVVAGRPGMGKTTLAVNLLRHALLQGEGAVMSSLEMRPVEVADMLLQIESGESVAVRPALRHGDLEPIERYQQAGRAVSDYPLTIVMAESPRKLRAEIERRQRSEPVRFVVVDYLQLMQGDRSRYGSRQEAVADISRNLKLMALQLDVVVIAVSQLSRTLESRTDKRPVLSDLRDSGQIEQDADAIFMLYRKGYYDRSSDDPSCSLIVAKNRRGPTASVHLHVDFQRKIFSEPETQWFPNGKVQVAHD